MRDVAGHEVSTAQMTRALGDIRDRTWDHWFTMRYTSASPDKILQTSDDLLDHVAARIASGASAEETTRLALSTAAECSLGALSVSCFPEGDQEILFPLLEESLTSEEIVFANSVSWAPNARTWIDTFQMSVVSGLVWDWHRVIGLLLREDYAPMIHEGVPYSSFDSISDAADLDVMDTLSTYLRSASGNLPSDWPTVPLCKPEDSERAEAAGRLDAAGPLTPDQRLLRVLLDDDQHTFEEALVARLVEHRETAEAMDDPAPRTLLPLGPLTLAVLAVQVHGWELTVRSPYLPRDLLGDTDAMRRAADTNQNNLGGWHAKY
ncbi:immunity 49 family protein [Spiractinospora alimapuensis]|uniref:immunity 49 family protein n=1 Tax=Spiractinospora alimapuensis TaxID=2820884 RepID=UPI001F1B419B|nr:immunity 49 family protein [Spiractinospora alimapuensis]QVQ53170.1 immunity 49 family protein [Spiractinospora alimapuensis]